MKQIGIYKEAYRQLNEAVPVSIESNCFDAWCGPDYMFTGLCPLVYRIAKEVIGDGLFRTVSRFVKDSKKILGRELHEEGYWFTKIEVDEPKARAERLEHLKNLIKLYEDEEK